MCFDHLPADETHRFDVGRFGALPRLGAPMPNNFENNRFTFGQIIKCFAANRVLVEIHIFIRGPGDKTIPLVA